MTDPMNTTNPAAKVLAAIMQFQARYKIPAKDQRAKVKTKSGAEFQYSYLDFHTLISTATPLLLELGLCVTFTLLAGESHTTLQMHVQHIEGGEYMSTVPMSSAATDDPRLFGSELSYKRRYLFLSMFNLMPPDEDDDGERAEERPKPARQPKTKTTAPPPQNEGPLLLEEALAMVDHAQQIKDLDAIAAKCKHLIGSDRDRLITALREAKTAIDTVPF